MKKTIYMLCFCTLFLAGCEEDAPEAISEKYNSYYYYSYELGESISAESLSLSDDFTPGPSLLRGDTLFVANVANKNLSLELYDRKRKKHLASLKSWTYKEETQSFLDKIEAIAISGNRLYLANIGSCIDVFDVNTLRFITRIGTRNWGQGSNQMLHSHAMAVTGGYIVIRMKNRLQVYQESDVTEEAYQKIPFYARGTVDGFDTNNGFFSHQMVVDEDGTILLADYGQAGNKKIQVIDPALIKKGDNIDMVDAARTLSLDFNPAGITLYKDQIFISDGSGHIRVYDRTRKEFTRRFNSFKGYALGKAVKLTIDGERLWVADQNKKQLVGMDIYRNEIREY